MNYLTNKYDMPFVTFIGVNHHRQSKLLGCGLVSNDNIDSLGWLFSIGLQYMHCIILRRIITDQDRVLQNMIQIVFSNTV